MDDVLLAAENRDKVREALADLPPKDQELLRWLFFEERDKDEICRTDERRPQPPAGAGSPGQNQVSRSIRRAVVHVAVRRRDPMTHAQAVQTGASERYLLEEMSELERHSFENHYFSCLECAEDVRTGGMLREGVKAGLLEAGGRPTASTRSSRLQAGRP